MKVNVQVMNSIDFAKMAMESGEEGTKIAMRMALEHLYRGAMDGAKNKDYIICTKDCYKMLLEYIHNH